MTFASATSGAFFERPENRARSQGSQRALIDDDHSFAKALRDFENLQALAAPNSIIAIHDVVPMTWMPERQRRSPRPRSIPATWRPMAAIVNRPDLVAYRGLHAEKRKGTAGSWVASWSVRGVRDQRRSVRLVAHVRFGSKADIAHRPTKAGWHCTEPAAAVRR